MSMHEIPLTKLERTGLEAHHLQIGTPSQLSDAFRLGIAWALKSLNGNDLLEGGNINMSNDSKVKEEIDRYLAAERMVWEEYIQEVAKKSNKEL